MDMNFLGLVLGAGVVGGAIVKMLDNIVQHFLKLRATKSHQRSETEEFLLFCQKTILHDRIKHLCTHFLQDGCIDYSDREDLLDMYDCYQKTGGNGNLETLMEHAKALPIKVK